jgi:dTDP-4-amino-4,6-dideoxygalactose transaminase
MEWIPFNRASAAGREMDYVAQVVRSGHLAGDGPFTQRCSAFFESELGAGKALLTTSCTHALEMAALLLDLRPGDEVILPSFTFVSTANAFVLRGARPVFADIRPDTLNLDESGLEALVTPRTRAIVPVHYGGVACEMDAILALARRHGLVVIEDNAHGVFGRYRGRALGTLGEMAAQSFHETKNLTCGEGGALLINDPRYEERAEIVREKGTNRSRFFRGQIDKYTWVDVGSSYLPSEMLAAFLWGQIEAREAIQARRRSVWERYRDGLAAWARDHGVALPVVPAHCDVPFHLFHMVLRSPGSRDALIAHLKARAIASTFHYLPLHLSEMGLRFGGRRGDCPVTERVSERLIRLPFFVGLTPEDQALVIDAVLAFRPD